METVLCNISVDYRISIIRKIMACSVFMLFGIASFLKKFLSHIISEKHRIKV